MHRRNFIKNSLILTTSGVVGSRLPLFAETPESTAGVEAALQKSNGLYPLFKNPETNHRPFVRWWWNGNKVEKAELIRELHLLKEAGIGGVEINPISFPFPAHTDDMGKKSLRWLSDEWIDMLQVTFDEARKLGMTCDLIVGSGWPFGSEDLQEDERAQVAIIYAENIEGPIDYECTEYNVISPIDPGVTDVNPLRKPEIISLKLVPDPINSIDEVIDLSGQIGQDRFRFHVPEGKHVFYALVKFTSFACVINGAPGAAGSILNHMDKQSVLKYLNHMSDTIQHKIGPLSNNIRALFTDSMELEGCNWNDDLAEEFKRRNGYDLMPYLPFTMYKVGRLGAVVDYNYGAKKTPAFEEITRRVRFDFEYTKAQLLRERFTETYLKWCRDLHVKSRAQAYGRGFFPLESSLGYDIPEGESWTTNWLRHKIGEEVSDEDYRRGRGYTHINKYVSSAAHLEGKRVVSCEEMTNTYLVFNATLELLKIGSDQSAMSGITHSIWHGFNYSPADAPFPGWIQYGSFYNEKNNWWPYFKYLNNYRARLSSQLQNADMYTDIAILPANYDLWSELGVQTDPFPEVLNVPYTSIIWESINKCGGAADYTTEIIIGKSEVKNGKLCYGKKQYGTLFLPEVTSIQPETLRIMYDFVQSGGRVFCIEKYPEKAPGFKDFQKRDTEVQQLIEKLKAIPERFVLVKKPEDNRFLEWYQQLMKQYKLPHYLEIENPNRFFMQTRYLRDDKSEAFFFNNAHRYNAHQTRITFDKSIVQGRYGWVWDLNTGERARLELDAQNSYAFDFGPADSLLVIFDKQKRGNTWKPLPTSGSSTIDLTSDWEVELRHKQENTQKTIRLAQLIDLKDREDTQHFSGTAVYKKTVTVSSAANAVLNLGTAHGISELFVNGQSCGVQWYGRRIYALSAHLKEGKNDIEVHITTTMGNYLKSLTDNKIAERWVNRKGREQEYQPTGIIGPVTLYNL